MVEARVVFRDRAAVEEYPLESPPLNYGSYQVGAKDAFDSDHNLTSIQFVERGSIDVPGKVSPRDMNEEAIVPHDSRGWINSIDYKPGISIDSSTCDESAQLYLQTTLRFTQEYAVAALEAIKEDAEDGSFLFFFRRDNVDQVRQVMTRINSSINGVGPSVHVTCRDGFNACNRYELTTGYTFEPGTGVSHVVVCPLFFSQPQIVDPCIRSQLGDKNNARSMIHYLVHLGTITATPNRQIVKDLVPAGWAEAHLLATPANTRNLRANKERRELRILCSMVLDQD